MNFSEIEPKFLRTEGYRVCLIISGRLGYLNIYGCSITKLLG